MSAYISLQNAWNQKLKDMYIYVTKSVIVLSQPCSQALY